MNENPDIVELNEQNFQEIMIDRLAERPVLLDIWADWCEPCKAQLPILEKLITDYQGKVLLAKLDAEHTLGQQIMAQMGVRSVPTLIVFYQGKMVQTLSGLQSEEALKTVLDPLTLSPVEQVSQQIELLVSQGEREEALLLLQGILREEPDNHALQVLQVNLLLELGRVEEARSIISVLPDDAEGIAQPRAKLEFYALVADAPACDELEKRLQADASDHEARYQLSIRQVIDDKPEDALENLLLIVGNDREFRDDGARELMIKLFNQLGTGDPLVKTFRGKLFGLLH